MLWHGMVTGPYHVVYVHDRRLFCTTSQKTNISKYLYLDLPILSRVITRLLHPEGFSQGVHDHSISSLLIYILGILSRPHLVLARYVHVHLAIRR